MLRFLRPAEPPEFAPLATTANQDMEAFCAGGKLPASKNFQDRIWRRWKDRFVEAQHGKCGYCEVFVLCVDDGDVEHYRPKSEVTRLSDDPAEWGICPPYTARVHGRVFHPVSPLGYWWHAYDWSNYLFACAICNESFKSALFPIVEDPRPPPAKGAVETPLLLNPYHAPDPIKHLHFSDLGQIEPRNQSRHGFETIRTCGLDRETLRQSRADCARKAHRLMDRLERHVSDDEFERFLDDVRDLGASDRPHAGMVRAIFEERTGLDWYALFGEDPQAGSS